MAAAKKAGAKAPVEPDEPMVLAMVVGGKTVRLEQDLPLGVLIDIAEADDTSWIQLVSQPLLAGSGRCLIELFKACCAHADVAIPAKITARMAYDAVQAVPDLSPSMIIDGLPTTADQATT